MLLGHVEKYPVIRNQPEEYCLGRGHVNFFKDKLGYLKERHELIKEEMGKRGFKISKTIDLNKYPKEYWNDWKPNKRDREIIKKRLIAKINLKPEYYRYYGEKKSKGFFVELVGG